MIKFLIRITIGFICICPAIWVAGEGWKQGWLFEGWSVNLAITLGLFGAGVFVMGKIIDWLDL